MREKYTIGLDYGTLSGRGVLARCSDGEILTSAVKEYTHGVMDQTLSDGETKLPPAWCLEYPADYIEVLDTVIPKLLKDSGVAKESILHLVLCCLLIWMRCRFVKSRNLPDGEMPM